MQKVSFSLPADQFQTFKDRLHSEFPEWAVRDFKPNVYAVHKPGVVSLFSINGFEPSPEQIERASQISVELQQSPKPESRSNHFKFDPVQKLRRKSKINIKMGVGSAWFGK